MSDQLAGVAQQNLQQLPLGGGEVHVVVRTAVVDRADRLVGEVDEEPAERPPATADPPPLAQLHGS
jgi:hypothetical protein